MEFKLQQQQQEERSEEFTMRAAISNIGTTTYEIANYLDKLLTPLTKSEYVLKAHSQV